MNEPSGDGLRGTVWIRLATVVAVVVTAGVAAGVMVGADLGTAPSGDAIVDRVADRYDDAGSYAGTVAVTATYENESGSVTQSGRASVQYLAPDSYRAEVRAPARYNGTVAATNGSVVWLTRPAGTTVVRPLNDTQQGWLSRVNLSAAVDRLDDNATVRRVGTATVEGEETYVLAVEPNNDSYRVNATVWVDTDDYRVRKLTTVGRHEGTTVRATVRYTDFRFDVSIHESTFQPPADRSVVVAAVDRTTYDSLAASRENTALPVPDPAVPEGFELGDVVVAETGDATTVTVTYGNGSDRIAVVVSERDPTDRIDLDTTAVEVGGTTGSYLERDGTAVVYWHDGDLTYAVAGSLSRSDLVAVGDSVAGG